MPSLLTVNTASPEASRTRHFGRGHLRPLDGVRGLAILMVIASHAFEANWESGDGLVRLAGAVLSYGFFGVDLFFVLSGFLITGILVDSVADDGYFRKFYARRVLRIFPLYYGVLLVLFLLTPALGLRWNGMGWLLVGYAQNLRPLAIVTFSPGAGLGLNHFWSLAIEEQFYMVWPAVIFLVRGRRALLWTTLGVAAGALALRLGLIALGVGQEPIHVNTITRADSLALGGALALAYRSRYWERLTQWAPWGLAAAVVTVVGSILLLAREFSPHPPFSRGMMLWIEGPRYTVLALGSACLIAWSLRPGSGCGWVFERGWLRFFGKYSYGIYVLHMVPLGLLVGAQRGFLFGLTHSHLVAVAGAGFSSLALSVAAAYACFHLYEKRFLRLKRFFDYDARPEAVPSFAGSGKRLQTARLVDL